MGRHRRASLPAPPPPPHPPQNSSTESGSDTEEEEEETPHAAAARMPPQNAQPQPPAAAAGDSDSSEEESDSDADADAQAFQRLPVSRSPTKPTAAAPQPESDGDGESSESEPDVPEPVQMKEAMTEKSAGQEDKKRPAPEPAASGREKKAKAEVGKSAPEVTPAGNGKGKKKAKAEPEKAASEQTPSGKAKKPGGKLEKSVPDALPPSSKSEKSVRARRTWLNADLIKILEATAAHVKREGALPKTDVLLAAVRDRLDRKDCTSGELYSKLRNLKKQYEETKSAGTVPTGKDTVRMYNLSEEIWGEKAKEAIAAASKNGPSSKKGRAKKEKMDGNSKVGKQKEDANQKANKSKQQVNNKEELGKDAKSGTSMEITPTATQNGDALTKLKRDKVDKDKMDIDPIHKGASTGNQNAGTWIEDETHEEEAELGDCVQHTHRSFDELQNLYPSLAGCVEKIEAQQPYGQSLKRAFQFIGDEKADALESKIQALGLLAMREEMHRDDLKKEVFNMLIDLKD